MHKVGGTVPLGVRLKLVTMKLLLGEVAVVYAEANIAADHNN